MVNLRDLAGNIVEEEDATVQDGGDVCEDLFNTADVNRFFFCGYRWLAYMISVYVYLGAVHATWQLCLFLGAIPMLV